MIFSYFPLIKFCDRMRWYLTHLVVPSIFLAYRCGWGWLGTEIQSEIRTGGSHEEDRRYAALLSFIHVPLWSFFVFFPQISFQVCRKYMRWILTLITWFLHILWNCRRARNQGCGIILPANTLRSCKFLSNFVCAVFHHRFLPVAIPGRFESYCMISSFTIDAAPPPKSFSPIKITTPCCPLKQYKASSQKACLGRRQIGSELCRWKHWIGWYHRRNSS